MLARLHPVLFFVLCLMSSMGGAGLAVGFLQFVSSRANPFSDIILALTLVPLGVVCPPLILYGFRKNQKQSLEELVIDEARRQKQFLTPEWAVGLDDGPSSDPLIDADRDYYQEFGVASTASAAEIEERHANIVNESKDATSPPSFEELAKMMTAYSVLSDPAQRVKYDLARVLGRHQAVGTLSLANRSAAARRDADEQVRATGRLGSMSVLSFCVIGLALLVAGAVSTFTSLELIHEWR